ncbi:MAG TPA: M23 family metallopeptidase, partial [Pyrinomonadaceae bacterium]|nr:M23 family metallopeptidase [Pyrinomonadaceae bacterium]
GKKVQTLYGHLETVSKTSGDAVKKREQIGAIGNAGGRYFCHLHFELREENSRDWNRAGVGYSAENKGWLDPSDFIDRNR